MAELLERSDTDTQLALDALQSVSASVLLTFQQHSIKAVHRVTDKEEAITMLSKPNFSAVEQIGQAVLIIEWEGKNNE